MRPLYFVFALTLIGQSGFRGYRLLLALYALHLGASAFTVGLLLAVYSLMQAAAGWWVGRWTDRTGCFWPMLVGALVSIAGFAIPYAWHSIAALFLASAIVGVAYCMVHVAQTNVVGLLSTQEDRSKNLADLSLVFSLTNFAGPLLAGLSVDHVGHADANLWFVAVAVISAIALIAGRQWLPARRVDSHRHSEGLRELLRNRDLLKVLLIGSLVFAAIDVFQSYMPVYTRGLGLSASVVGAIMACFPAAAFISRVCLRWLLQYVSPEGVLWRAFLVATAALVAMPFFDDAVPLGVLAFVYGFGLCVGQPITLILAYQTTSNGRSGEVVGIRETVNQVTRVAAPVVFGTVASVLGMLPVFFLGGGMLALGALLLRAGLAAKRT